MKAVVAAFNQEKALVGAFSVITNLRMELFQALLLCHLVPGSCNVSNFTAEPRAAISNFTLNSPWPHLRPSLHHIVACQTASIIRTIPQGDSGLKIANYHLERGNIVQ